MGRHLAEDEPGTTGPVAADVRLFGGALSARIPARLADVSLARQVPDHQEAFSDPSLDQALVIEVLERVEGVEDGRAAAEFFFSDLMEQNEAEEGARLDKVEELKGGTGGATTSPVLSGLAASPPPPSPSTNPSAVQNALDACSYAALATGTASISKGGEGGRTPPPEQPRNAVAVALVLLRFPAVRSDVLVSLTTATAIAPGSSSEPQAAENVAAGGGPREIAAAAEELLRSIVESLRVFDWGLWC